MSRAALSLACLLAPALCLAQVDGGARPVDAGRSQLEGGAGGFDAGGRPLDGGAPVLDAGAGHLDGGRLGGLDESDRVDDDSDSMSSEAEQSSQFAGDGGLLYSADLSDDQLSRRFVDDLPSLGSISVGLAEAGRLVNGVHLEPSEHLSVVVPESAWGTAETVDFLNRVALEVAQQVPGAPPLRVNHIGAKEGGYLRPHHSHQSGRDVDIGFYYREGVDPAHLLTTREKAMNLAANWAFVRAVAAHTDVQVILLDYRVQKVLFEYALSIGEDRAWLDSLFHEGPSSLFQHVRRHRDHFHVRFFGARSQELGWRIQPLLARRADENIVIYRVKRGDTLGGIAQRNRSTVKLIQNANGLATTTLSVGRTLKVPIRGPCTQCPLPTQVVVPPRRAPPESRDGG